MKSYALYFTCQHADKSRSNPFRVYDFEETKTAGECYRQALEDIKLDDPSITNAILVNMVKIE